MLANKKEIYEAINAGNRAFESFNKALEMLDNAKGWGIFDIVGGGFIASIVKRKKIKEANQYVEQAKRDLAIFNRELQDVDAFDELKIDLNGLVGVGDLLFDNIFFDLAMQTKINSAMDDINLAMDKIEYILDALERRL